MILHQLKVRNIRSYESGEVDLGEGITALSGEIGSGKTSLLHALEMALFGFAEVHPIHLLRHGSNEGEVEVLFEDAGSTVGLRRTIQRRHSKGEETTPGQTCSLVRDGHRAAYTTSELKKEVIKLMGFPDDPNPRSHSDLWRWAVYVPQESMREVLSQRSEERLETIRRAHGLEEYRLARDNAEVLASTLRAKAREYDSAAREHAAAPRELEELLRRREEGHPRLQTLQTELDHARHSLAEVEGKLAEKNRVERELAVALATFQARTAALGTARKDLETARQRTSELTEMIAREGLAIQEIDRKLAAYRFSPSSLEEQEARVAQANVALEASRSALNQLQAARERVQATAVAHREADERRKRALEVVRDRGREVTQRAQDLKALSPPGPEPRVLKTVEEEIREVHTELSRLAEEVGKTRHTEEEIRELIHSGHCPRCGQGVDATAFGRHLEEASSKRASLEEARAERQARLGSLEMERTGRIEHDKALLHWQRRNDQVSQGRREEESAKRALEEAESEVATKGATLKALEDAARNLAPAETDHAAASEAWKGAQAALDALKQERHQMEVLRVQRESAQKGIATGENDLSNRRRDLSTLETALESRVQEVKTAEFRVRELEGSLTPFEGVEKTKLSMAEKERAASAALISSQAEMKHLEDDILRVKADLERRKTAEDRAARSRSLADWLGLFGRATEEMEKKRLERIHYDFAREFSRYFTILVDDNSMRAVVDPAFTPTVHTGSFETPPDALSGGERTALALAYRLALGYTVRSAHRLRLESLILDEPTDGFSSAQVTKLSDLLRSSGHRQILLVSHDKNLVAIADRIIRVEKQEGRSYLS